MADTRTSLLTRFARNDRGSIAILFALTLVPIIGIVSLAIDYGRTLKVKSQIAHAADAATASLLQHLPANGADLSPFVRTQLDANLPKHLKDLPFTLNVSETRRVIELTVKTDVRMALAGLVGVSKMDVQVLSTQIIPKVPTMLESPAGVGTVKPSDIREAQETMRRAAEAVQGAGGNAPIALREPSPEEIKRLREAINQKIREALQEHGPGPLDMDVLREALGR